jgi:ubiquinone/menaquinone biosynthesis C-methylase UbiE
VSEPRRSTPSTAEVAAQFGEHARQYAVSPLHREGATRLMLVEHMEPVVDEVLLDVGTGPGHVALTFAPLVGRAVGLDAAPEMLGAAHLAARRDGVANADWVGGDVHRLPFRDRAFDLVVSRASPHHFSDIRRAVGEMARVLKRGGRLGIADGMVPDDDELDAFINDLDCLHDPTTVRNYRPSEWRDFVAAAGLRLDWIESEVYELDRGCLLSDWLARSGASSAVLEEARRRMVAAPERVRRYLRLRSEEGDLRFALPRVVMVARRVD